MAKTGQKQDRKDLKKHSAAIQVQNNITLLQRKAWNAMLWHAYDDLPAKDIHEIPVQQLIQLVGYDSKDEAYIKEVTLAMLNCIVEWNVLGKDGSNVWGAAVLLASVQIENGICSYGFAPHLRHKLHNPDMFARIDLDMQKRFDSKHALALWELCTDYLGAKRDHGETPWITLEDFRKLMGIAEGTYSLYKLFSQRVLTPAISEINHVSDFRVTVDYQRQGRKITALKFKMRRVALLPEAGAVQARLFPDLDDMPAVVIELKHMGLSSSDAWDIWQKGFAGVQEDARPDVDRDDDGAAFLQYVREKIHLLKRRQASGKVDNATGFLLKALRLNWSNPEFEIEAKKEAQKETAKALREQEARRKTLEAQKAELEKARDKEMEEACSALARNEPDVLEEAAAWATREVQGFMMLYDRGKSAPENYRDRFAVQALLNPYIRQQRPEHFHAIEQRHATGIGDIEAQLQAL